MAKCLGKRVTVQVASGQVKTVALLDSYSEAKEQELRQEKYKLRVELNVSLCVKPKNRRNTVAGEGDAKEERSGRSRRGRLTRTSDITRKMNL